MFFLESADWSVETAVGLWLESGLGQSQSRSAHGFGWQYNDSYTHSSSSSSTYPNTDYHENNSSGGHKRKRSRSLLYDANEEPDFSNSNWCGPPGPYLSKEVVIENLDPAWSTWVSRSSGRVYFKHVASGQMQSQVPPGFADDVRWSEAQKKREEEGAYDSDLENEVGRSPTLESRATVDENMGREFESAALARDGNGVYQSGMTDADGDTTEGCQQGTGSDGSGDVDGSSGGPSHSEGSSCSTDVWMSGDGSGAERG